ncbi:hypothetical protein SCO11_08790 [Legionella pneumophila serogroup 1]|uniref:hypothetical protein n=1 Tax=Legionella pneumophila TaxID=446 RepID=UPI000487BD21|nr:hypothetical protein [Legionella pneumophila]AMV12751.1 hypothetical protein ULM_00470 [Legionella pneumophila]ANN91133.1 hypothetical protein A9P85_00225 [Legionella pneumophila]MCH9059672.1 hypothetical protein [Legionella pneumophila serogroup 1]MCH9062604.1 hypothetical protein [Legionella pneumophila serogroup 1]MCH9065284.1 hypothetical protein [Legionella pneumophila serogroup 1]
MKRVHHHPATHSHPSNATVQVSNGQQTVVVNPNPSYFPGQPPMYHPNSFFTTHHHSPYYASQNQHYHQQPAPNTHQHP